MAGSIFLVGERGGLIEMRQEPYEAEDLLQELPPFLEIEMGYQSWVRPPAGS